MKWVLQHLPYPGDFETKKVLKKLNNAHRALAELKGVAQSIPRQEILINTLVLQEAKDSSAVEDIVTTHDEIYKSNLAIERYISPQTKEVQNYTQALRYGFEILTNQKGLSLNNILSIQEILEENKAGFRKVPGTTLKNDFSGEVVYNPPQNANTILELMRNFENHFNQSNLSDYDPILKMAILHFQFESIHPFYDGNGRTGRILNILYLVGEHLLDIPILYLSRYIIKNKREYYTRLQHVRDDNDWENWLLYMITAVEETAKETLVQVAQMREKMILMKNILRNNYHFYSQELLNHLFKLPYTKIELLQNELGISRVTASNYLNRLAKDKILSKHKLGKSNYYVNDHLIDVLIPKMEN